ncbi:MAG: 50S ribosomal protein L13 [Candidatus Nomurabacteria bacterium]|jgi:large subunit ribosomal protein L13|nr:50S ribosomal protein L13 [Candidatus Nomurabacteria bacterium]
MKLFKTFSAKPAEIERQWFLIDAAESATLGRLATEIAKLLMGKGKVTFTSHVDNGDFVVLVNASQIKVTGNKETDKKYYRHSGYVGNLKTESLMEMREKYPERIVIEAVRGMLPKNKLIDGRLARLKVFAGAEHAHEAQTPKKVEVK